MNPIGPNAGGLSIQLMLVGHLPTDPPEATLVLAAAGACNGMLRDGTRSGGIPHAPSLRQLAQLLGIHIDAVRRGVRHLQAAGEARMDNGVVVEPEALRRRWHDARALGDREAPAAWFQVRITADLLKLGLAPRPLLLAGLVAGLFNDRRRELRLSVPFLAERLGLPLRTVERLAVVCARAGALHSWTRPAAGGGCRKLKVWCPGPRPEGQPVCESATRIQGAEGVENASSSGGRGDRQMAVGPSPNGGRDHRPVAVGPSSGGGHLPDCLPEPPGSTARNAREARGAEVAPRPEPEPEPVKLAQPRTLVAAILRTTLRSRLPELARYRFAVDLDAALQRAGMTVDDFEQLWLKAQRSAAQTPGSDPAAILSKMLAGPWRAELDAADEQQRHNAARARGGATRRAERSDGPYGAPAPSNAVDVAGDVLRRLKTSHG